MPDNATKRAREGSSSSKKSDDGHSDITLKSIMQKLGCIQDSLDSNFAKALCEINSVRADVNAVFSSKMPDNATKRAREGSSSSKKSDDGHSDITLKANIM